MFQKGAENFSDLLRISQIQDMGLLCIHNQYQACPVFSPWLSAYGTWWGLNSGSSHFEGTVF